MIPDTKVTREDLLAEHTNLMILAAPHQADRALMGAIQPRSGQSFAVYDLDQLIRVMADVLLIHLYTQQTSMVSLMLIRALSLLLCDHIRLHQHLTGLNRPSIPGSVCWPVCVALDRRKLPFHLLTLN